MRPRAYRRDDFDDAPTGATAAFAIVGIVGFAMGVGATLLVQWLTA